MVTNKNYCNGHMIRKRNIMCAFNCAHGTTFSTFPGNLKKKKKGPFSYAYIGFGPKKSVI